MEQSGRNLGISAGVDPCVSSSNATVTPIDGNAVETRGEMS
jgi:hypothetical protein